MVRERLIGKSEFVADAKHAPVATPDKSLAISAQQAGMSVQTVDSPSAASIARLGLRKLKAGEAVTPEQLAANYIRCSDAEIFGKPVP